MENMNVEKKLYQFLKDLKSYLKIIGIHSLDVGEELKV